jgi:hypothetical protein
MNLADQISQFAYWGPEESGGAICTPPGVLSSRSQRLDVRQVKSNFFSMDIAECENGNWMVVELGDGQVTGLPPHANLKDFYTALAYRFQFE